MYKVFLIVRLYLKILSVYNLIQWDLTIQYFTIVIFNYEIEYDLITYCIDNK